MSFRHQGTFFFSLPKAIGSNVRLPEWLLHLIFKLFGRTIPRTVSKTRLHSLNSKYPEEKWSVVWGMTYICVFSQRGHGMTATFSSFDSGVHSVS